MARPTAAEEVASFEKAHAKRRALRLAIELPLIFAAAYFFGQFAVVLVLAVFLPIAFFIEVKEMRHKRDLRRKMLREASPRP